MKKCQSFHGRRPFSPQRRFTGNPPLIFRTFLKGRLGKLTLSLPDEYEDFLISLYTPG